MVAGGICAAVFGDSERRGYLELKVGVSDTKPSYFPANMHRHRITFEIVSPTPSHSGVQLSTAADLALINSTVAYTAHTAAVKAAASRHLLLAVDGWQTAMLIERAMTAGATSVTVCCAPDQPLLSQLFCGDPAVSLRAGPILGLGCEAAVISLIDPRTGCLRQDRLSDWLRLKSELKTVEPTGLQLWAQVVECEYVARHTELLPGSVCDSVDLSLLATKRPPEMCVQLGKHKWRALSEPVMISSDLKPGQVSTFKRRVEAIADGVVHCVVCWFVEVWSGGVIDFGGTDDESHACQLAFMPPKGFYGIRRNEKLLIECATEDELLIADVRAVCSEPRDRSNTTTAEKGTNAKSTNAKRARTQ